MLGYFISGIDTNAGKTLVSAICTEALGACYWKPIQSGNDALDRHCVESLVTNTKATFLTEKYLLKTPVSPHQAAEIDGISIEVDDFELPFSSNPLIVEGAGGLMVPINLKGDLLIDLIKKFQLPVILVSNYYLGSINHTLLSIACLQQHHVPIKGIIFNGKANLASRSIILKKSGLEALLDIDQASEITSEFVQKYASKLRPKLL